MDTQTSQGNNTLPPSAAGPSALEALQQRVAALEAELATRDEKHNLALRQAEELEILKNTIVSNIHHEMRTPVLQVKASVALLDEVLHDEKPDHHNTISLINMAKEAITRLEDTVGRISQLIDTDELREEPVALVESVDLAIHHLQRSWAYKEAAKRIEKCLKSAEIPLVLGDKRGVAQILRLLLENALKFSPNDSPVKATVAPNDDETVTITVSDKGIGIAPEYHERIFEPFFQVDSSSTRPFSGAGVGLTLARRVARHMGSDIRVKSALGSGSDFSFTLRVYPL